MVLPNGESPLWMNNSQWFDRILWYKIQDNHQSALLIWHELVIAVVWKMGRTWYHVHSVKLAWTPSLQVWFMEGEECSWPMHNIMHNILDDKKMVFGMYKWWWLNLNLSGTDSFSSVCVKVLYVWCKFNLIQFQSILLNTSLVTSTQDVRQMWNCKHEKYQI